MDNKTTKNTTETENTPEIKKETAKAPKKEKQKVKTLERIDPNELIDVQSCTYGELVYISRKTGYKIIWDDFGSINLMTVGDLIDMRNGQKRFFEEPWIVLLGERAPIISNYLQVEKYYKNITKLEDFDKIFEYEPDDIPSVMKDLSNGTKEVIARRAYALIQEGSLDSCKMIEAIEATTGYKIQE